MKGAILFISAGIGALSFAANEPEVGAWFIGASCFIILADVLFNPQSHGDGDFPDHDNPHSQW